VAGRTTLLGLDFPLSPKWQSSFAATYVLPFKTAGQWKVALDGQYESARFVDIYNTAQTKVRKQIFFNGNIGYTGEDKSWSTGVNVKNIFDLRRGQAGGYALNAGSQVNYYRAYNEPRTVNIYVSKTF
jgi:iron complex outermembrane receptor protein